MSDYCYDYDYESDYDDYYDDINGQHNWTTDWIDYSEMARDSSKTSGVGIVFFVVLLLCFGVQLGFGLQFVWQWAKKEPSNDDVQAKKEPSNDDVRAKRIQATRQEHLGVQAAKTTTV